MIAETDKNGELLRAYAWLDDLPIVQIDVKGHHDDKGRGKRRDKVKEHIAYLHTDHLGAPRLATNSNQQVVWRWGSDAFENKKSDDSDDEYENDNKITVNIRHSRGYADKESRLIYVWNRYLDPATGRWLTSDPIGLSGGLNSYAFVNNNPLRYTDPTGLVLETWEPGGLYGPNQSVCGSGIKFPELWFREACETHDRCYDTCGANKTWCDFQFQWNAQQSCAPGDWRCSLLAQAYFEGVLHGGYSAYRDAQQKACQGCRQ